MRRVSCFFPSQLDRNEGSDSCQLDFRTCGSFRGGPELYTPYVKLLTTPALLVLPFDTGTWDAAFTLAQQAVAQMTIDEKVGVVTGQGQFSSKRALITP